MVVVEASKYYEKSLLRYIICCQLIMINYFMIMFALFHEIAISFSQMNIFFYYVW